MEQQPTATAEKRIKLTTESVGFEFSLTVKSGDNYVKATAQRFTTIANGETEEEAFARCKTICTKQVSETIDEMV